MEAAALLATTTSVVSNCKACVPNGVLSFNWLTAAVSKFAKTLRSKSGRIWANPSECSGYSTAVQYGTAYERASTAKLRAVTRIASCASASGGCRLPSKRRTTVRTRAKHTTHRDKHTMAMDERLRVAFAPPVWAVALFLKRAGDAVVEPESARCPPRVAPPDARHAARRDAMKHLVAQWIVDSTASKLVHVSPEGVDSAVGGAGGGVFSAVAGWFHVVISFASRRRAGRSDVVVVTERDAALDVPVGEWSPLYKSLYYSNANSVASDPNLAEAVMGDDDSAVAPKKRSRASETASSAGGKVSKTDAKRSASKTADKTARPRSAAPTACPDIDDEPNFSPLYNSLYFIPGTASSHQAPSQSSLERQARTHRHGPSPGFDECAEMLKDKLAVLPFLLMDDSQEGRGILEAMREASRNQSLKRREGQSGGGPVGWILSAISFTWVFLNPLK